MGLTIQNTTLSSLSILEKLQATNQEMEIWWDSSPLIYESWIHDVVSEAPLHKKRNWSNQLVRLFDFKNPEKSLIKGVTTNPILVWQEVSSNRLFWLKILKDLLQTSPNLSLDDAHWMLYKKVIHKGADHLLPLWYQSEGKFGWFSAQLDPRLVENSEQMLVQALELSKLAPNIMVKVPGSKQGYQVIEELTALGISTNNTLAFTVPQFTSYIKAIQRGLYQAEKKQLNLDCWRSVFSYMCGRYGEKGDLVAQAQAREIQLSELEIRWAELAIFKKIHEAIEKNNYPIKLLICSMRNGSSQIDSGVSLHLEKTAGSKAVYTCPPGYIKELMEREDYLESLDAKAVYEPVPTEILEKLLHIPYFVDAYTDDGLSEDEFNHHPAFVNSVMEVTNATRKMLNLVDSNILMRTSQLAA